MKLIFVVAISLALVQNLNASPVPQEDGKYSRDLNYLLCGINLFRAWTSGNIHKQLHTRKGRGSNFCDIIHVHLIPIDVNSQEQKHLNLVLQHISASVWPVKI